MAQIDTMRELICLLNQYSKAYYIDDNPLVSDKQYDDLYDQLVELEKETGITLSNSPTVHVQGGILDGFKKVTHSKPMLSADKTKNIQEIERWINNREYYASYKLDGLTLVTTYIDGKLVSAVTRGDGYVGEDVTSQAKFISNIPLSIPYPGRLEIRGECLISWEEFNRINSTLENPYRHPRNLAAGTLRNLDEEIIKDRKLSYIVYECITSVEIDDKVELLQLLNEYGFTVVPFAFDAETVEKNLEVFIPEQYAYPVDGIIFELRSMKESIASGATQHHENCRMALKWADDTYETTLRDVVWQVSRTGLLAPVAVFDEIDLDGALTTRATLHNLSIVKNLKLGIGDTIKVYRSNKVIPCVDKNLTLSDNLVLPTRCPVCGSPVVEKTSESGTRNLYCLNEDCGARLIGKLELFVSKYAMNIDGLSTATLETLIENHYITCYSDLYSLGDFKDSLISQKGFGEKWFENTINSIEKSKHTTLERFIVAMGIPNIGRSAAKSISKIFHGDVKEFINQTAFGFKYTELDGFGQKAEDSIRSWLYEFPKDELSKLVSILDWIIPENENNNTNNIFVNKKIAVTGKLEYFTRDSINEKIVSLGAAPVSSVSKNCDYLITNTPDSGSSKNQKAQELGIPIITEKQFLEMIGEK